MKKIRTNTPSSESATVAINSLAQQKIAAGVKVFNLSAGEPKLPPHKAIVQAVNAALKAGKTQYPPVSGLVELKQLATQWMNATYNCHYKPENCLVVNGGKFGLYLLLQLLLKKGDEVIIAAPYWVSYPAITKLFGGVAKIIETHESNQWKLTPALLKKACNTKSRILLLNNGANPTGTLYSRQELVKILQIAKEKNLLVISDEVYSGLTYDNAPYVSCGEFTKYQDRMIVIQSCSKNFSMTGWRVGFVLASPNIVAQLTSLVGQSTSGVTTISQWAAVGVLKQSKKINVWVWQQMQKRRDVIIKAFKTYFDLTISPPSSALYVFVSLHDLGVNEKNSTEFCKQALEHADVALVPGKAFGKEGFVRFSFGAEAQDLKAGVKALATFCRKFYGAD